MAERLKQMSLRKFRVEIADLREPVDVSRRDPDGNIQILGYWTPYMQYAPDSVSLEPLEDQPPVPGGTTAIRDGQYVREERVPEIEIPVDDEAFPVGEDSEFDRHPRTATLIRTPEEAAAVVAVNPVRAVPKPSQRKGRR